MGILACPFSQRKSEPGALTYPQPRQYALDFITWCLGVWSVFTYFLHGAPFSCHRLFTASATLGLWIGDPENWVKPSQLPSGAWLYAEWDLDPMGRVLHADTVFHYAHIPSPHLRPTYHLSLSAGTPASFVPAPENTAVAFPRGPPQSPVKDWTFICLMSDSWFPRGYNLENWIDSWW